MKLKKPSYKRNYLSYDLMLDLTTCLHRLVRCLAWLHNHFCRTARRLFTVRTMPITIKITLGQNVKNARMPKPTGFGLGSRVRPSCAARITTSSGPIPIQRSTKPIHKKRDTRLLVAAAISLIFANYPSNETKLSRG